WKWDLPAVRAPKHMCMPKTWTFDRFDWRLVRGMQDGSSNLQQTGGLFDMRRVCVKRRSSRLLQKRCLSQLSGCLSAHQQRAAHLNGSRSSDLI
ncbi:hypothetical protein OAP65_04960, partial [Litorivicinus sp.]|nr:hypothetical protein [Litorivicinus sp.]